MENLVRVAPGALPQIPMQFLQNAGLNLTQFSQSNLIGQAGISNLALYQNPAIAQLIQQQQQQSSQEQKLASQRIQHLQKESLAQKSPSPSSSSGRKASGSGVPKVSGSSVKSGSNLGGHSSQIGAHSSQKPKQQKFQPTVSHHQQVAP